MTTRAITPFIMGSGRSADALKKCLAILGLQPPIQIPRGESLAALKLSNSKHPHPILLIANPHGLHAQAMLDGQKAGFQGIVVEKPACVTLDEIEALKSMRIPVAVCHGYRQGWGVQTLKTMLDSGELGELISIEGRYWQSSTASRAISPPSAQFAQSWKNDPKLSGGSDALVDIGVHWVDAVCFLMGETRFEGVRWSSYANAETPHRDSHVQLALHFSRGRRALGSVSKTVHGATNQFELHLIGTQKSASWKFLNPDEIEVGHGSTRSVLVRRDTVLGSHQPPFHGLGWLEGYLEIVRQLVNEVQGQPGTAYPKLAENLAMLESVFRLKTH